MLILGNGLTAAIALKVFPNSRAITSKEFVSAPHKAVLRFRSDEVSKITGIPFKKVKVYKGIYEDGAFVPPNIGSMNSYSLKVTGGLYDRSIADTTPAERFVAPENFSTRLLESVKDRINIYDGIDSNILRGNIIISTLPMGLNQHIFDIGKVVEFTKSNYSSIYVNRFVIKECDVYQTIYYPKDNTPIYRATIECNQLIIESTKELTLNDFNIIQESFRISDLGEPIIKNYKQSIGKMTKINELDRQEIIVKLTKMYKVYSLGRVACWRPSVLLDDVVKDLYKIRDMIQLTPYERAMRWK